MSKSFCCQEVPPIISSKSHFSRFESINLAPTIGTYRNQFWAIIHMTAIQMFKDGCHVVSQSSPGEIYSGAWFPDLWSCKHLCWTLQLESVVGLQTDIRGVSQDSYASLPGTLGNLSVVLSLIRRSTANPNSVIAVSRFFDCVFQLIELPTVRHAIYIHSSSLTGWSISRPISHCIPVMSLILMPRFLTDGGLQQERKTVLIPPALGTKAAPLNLSLNLIPKHIGIVVILYLPPSCSFPTVTGWRQSSTIRCTTITTTSTTSSTRTTMPIGDMIKTQAVTATATHSTATRKVLCR